MERVRFVPSSLLKRCLKRLGVLRGEKPSVEDLRNLIRCGALHAYANEAKDSVVLVEPLGAFSNLVAVAGCDFRAWFGREFPPLAVSLGSCFVIARGGMAKWLNRLGFAKLKDGPRGESLFIWRTTWRDAESETLLAWLTGWWMPDGQKPGGPKACGPGT